MLERQHSHKMIYLADDDRDDRDLFFDALKELSLPVSLTTAEDGLDLLDKLSQNGAKQPDIIFLDINMPGINGFECLKELRSGSLPFKNAKVIMFSTSSSRSHIELSFKLGADFYAVKPSSFIELKKLLYEIITLDWQAEKHSKERLHVKEKNDFIK